MNKRIFSKEQIEELLKNPNVEKCSKKAISYRKDFKLLSLEKYHQGMTPFGIFRKAGFDINMIGREVPGDCLYRWRKQGRYGLKREKSNGGPKIADRPDKEKIKYLEAEVAYLKEENLFLAKLRKKS